MRDTVSNHDGPFRGRGPVVRRRRSAAGAAAAVLACAAVGFAQPELKTGFSFVDANGIRFAYLEEGEGPLLLLLHGYPETATSWRAVQSRLADAGYRVVAPNLRGYPPSGRSAAGDYGVGTLGADALALIDALGAEDAVVVGHDWGAAATYAAATAGPEKLRALVAIAIPHPRGIAGDPSVLLDAPHFLYYQLPFVRWWVSRNDFAHVERIYADWSPEFDWSGHDFSDIKRAMGAAEGLDGTLGFYWSYFADPEPGTVRASADTTIRVPSLVIAGAADGAVDVARFETARPAFEDRYVYVELPGVGHFPQIEAPEAVAEAILEFLAGLR